MGRVISVHRVAVRDGDAEVLESANVIADFGIEGDWRSRRGRSRQLTLIEAEALTDVARVLGLDRVAPGASRRQLVVEGIALNDAVGQRLRVGSVLLEIEDRCDPCPNLEVKIAPGAQRALENRGGVCARVVEGGMITPGDPVTVVET
jgi:MOSC domain-containing protein YiiM